MELPFDPAIPQLLVYLRTPETPVRRSIRTPMFTAAFWKQPKCPSVDEQMTKMQYMHSEILRGYKKEGTLTLYDSTARRGDYYAK